MKNSSKPFFSVIIPTLNEENYISHLLKDLENQTFKDFEVIVADGNSLDLTKEKTIFFKKRLPLTFTSCQKRGVSFQRNSGASKANGKWLLFMDADNRIHQKFLLDFYNQIKLKNKVQKNFIPLSLCLFNLFYISILVQIAFHKYRLKIINYF